MVGIEVDHAAVVERRHRLDVAADRLDHQRHQLLGALGEIDVRVLLEQDADVGAAHALFGEMAVRIELDADDRLRSDDLAHARDQVALAVVIAVARPSRHAGRAARRRPASRRAAGRGSRRACSRSSPACVGPGRLGPEAGALDQLEAFLPGAPPRDPERRRCRACRGPGACRAGSRASVRRLARLVGIGEKELVSVASDAVKMRIQENLMGTLAP